MKRTFPIIAVVGLLWLTACASLETNAYRTIGSIAITVDAAMGGYGEYVRAGRGSLDQQAKVEEKYLQYQAAMRVVQTAVNAYRLNPDATQLRKALAVAAASATDVTELVYAIIAPKKGP